MDTLRPRWVRPAAAGLLLMLLVGCGSIRPPVVTVPAVPRTASPPAAPSVPVPRPEPSAAPSHDADAPPAVPEAPADDSARPVAETGVASWYGRPFHGRRTASGERFDMNALTAAHKTLPFQSLVLVRNLANQREVIVRVNDRGPFRHGRIIDLSRAAARTLGIAGVAQVEVRLLAPDSTSTQADAALQ